MSPVCRLGSSLHMKLTQTCDVNVTSRPEKNVPVSMMAIRSARHSDVRLVLNHCLGAYVALVWSIGILIVGNATQYKSYREMLDSQLGIWFVRNRTGDEANIKGYRYHWCFIAGISSRYYTLSAHRKHIYSVLFIYAITWSLSRNSKEMKEEYILPQYQG